MSLCRYGRTLDAQPPPDLLTPSPLSHGGSLLGGLPAVHQRCLPQPAVLQAAAAGGGEPGLQLQRPRQHAGLLQAACCVMDASQGHGCEAAFVSLLVEFGANLNLVKWESLGPESRGRREAGTPRRCRSLKKPVYLNSALPGCLFKPAE